MLMGRRRGKDRNAGETMDQVMQKEEKAVRICFNPQSICV